MRIPKAGQAEVSTDASYSLNSLKGHYIGDYIGFRV